MLPFFFSISCQGIHIQTFERTKFCFINQLFRHAKICCHFCTEPFWFSSRIYVFLHLKQTLPSINILAWFVFYLLILHNIIHKEKSFYQVILLFLFFFCILSVFLLQFFFFLCFPIFWLGHSNPDYHSSAQPSFLRDIYFEKKTLFLVAVDMCVDDEVLREMHYLANSFKSGQ